MFAAALDHPGSGDVTIRVLGAVAATAGDVDIPLGGPRARALVAALVVARGRMLSADALLRDVWSERTPGVRSALRATVSRLRATPLGAFLYGGRQGYALTQRPGLVVDLWALDALSMDELLDVSDARLLDGTGEWPYLPTARGSCQRLLRAAAIRAIDAEPGHPQAVALARRLAVLDPADAEVRALLTGTANRAGGAGAVPATTTRRIGVPAPLALSLPRPDDESRIAAALRLSRLVTLVGPSGVGKSRLAIEWARGAGGSTQEHVWFCDAGTGWMAALARIVGADPSLDSIAERMRTLRGTVVLDGIDHDAASEGAGLALLLQRVPGVSALVTARRPLGVPGEGTHHVKALDAADARALFLLRAPFHAESAGIDALTSAVGGLPLGIELAAARASQTSLATVIAGIGAGADDADALTVALDATLGLLSAGERDALERLTVFYGAFDPESAIAVGDLDAGVVEVLLGWALLADESTDGLALLRLPDVVRRRLGVVPDHALRTRHREWFARRAFVAFGQLTTDAADTALRRMGAEQADIDAAFDDAIDGGDRENALRIAAGIAWVGLLSGAQAASLSLGRRAAQVVGAAPADVEATAGLGLGMLSYQLGFMDDAASVLRHALEQARLTGDPDLMALSHASLAYLSTLSPAGTRTAIESIRAADGFAGAATLSVQAMVALISAQVARARGALAEALTLAETAHGLARRSGHGWVLLMSGVVSAKVLIDGRDPRAALTVLRAVVADDRVLADPIGVMIAASVAAGAAAGIGADAAAARIVGAVDSIGPRYGFDPRANEPADFERYRRTAQQGLTPEGWRDAYAHGSRLTVAELVGEVSRLSARTAS
jgi:hypothetical protein